MDGERADFGHRRVIDIHALMLPVSLMAGILSCVKSSIHFDFYSGRRCASWALHGGEVTFNISLVLLDIRSPTAEYTKICFEKSETTNYIIYMIFLTMI